MFYKVSTLGLSDVLTLFLITNFSDQGTEQPRKLTYFLGIIFSYPPISYRIFLNIPLLIKGKNYNLNLPSWLEK